MPAPPPDRWSVGAAGAAALVWGSYYFFVLALPPSENLPLILLTPLFGGAATLGASVLLDRVDLAVCWRALRNPRLLLSGSCFVAFQFAAVLGTRQVGAVNTSIIVLASDVIGTPFLFHALWREEGRRFRQPAFWLGVAIISSGAVLTILAGGSPEPLTPVALALAIPLFLVSTLFVVSTEAANRQLPMLVVLGVGPLVLSGAASVGAAVVVGPAAVLGDSAPITLALLLSMSVLNYAVAPLLFFWSARRISLVIPSLLQAGIPVFALVYVAGLGLQPVTEVGLVGVVVAVTGAVVAVRSAREVPPTAATFPVP